LPQQEKDNKYNQTESVPDPKTSSPVHKKRKSEHVG